MDKRGPGSSIPPIADTDIVSSIADTVIVSSKADIDIVSSTPPCPSNLRGGEANAMIHRKQFCRTHFTYYFVCFLGHQSA